MTAPATIPTPEFCFQHFQDLDSQRLFAILKLRVDVFVVEQQCAYPELDNFDQHADTLHLSAYSSQCELMAYLRILPPGTRFTELSLGRIVVSPAYRGLHVSGTKQTLGQTLIDVALTRVDRSWPDHNVTISAQVALQSYYAEHGFQSVGAAYLEDDIPHIKMQRQ